MAQLRLKAWARSFRQEVAALQIAIRDPRTPFHAKALGAFVVAYALSPIDLIPDFVPVLGLLDDLILVPIGLAVLLRMIPKEVMSESRAKAAEAAASKSLLGAAFVVVAWIGLAILAAWFFLKSRH